MLDCHILNLLVERTQLKGTIWGHIKISLKTGCLIFHPLCPFFSQTSFHFRRRDSQFGQPTAREQRQFRRSPVSGDARWWQRWIQGNRSQQRHAIATEGSRLTTQKWVNYCKSEIKASSFWFIVIFGVKNDYYLWLLFQLCVTIYFQPPFEENGIASPIDKPKNSPIANSLGSSIDSALMSNLSNTYPSKNRFLSGDQVATGRDTMIRRQLFSIGKLACLDS